MKNPASSHQAEQTSHQEQNPCTLVPNLDRRLNLNRLKRDDGADGAITRKMRTSTESRKTHRYHLVQLQELSLLRRLHHRQEQAFDGDQQVHLLLSHHPFLLTCDALLRILPQLYLHQDDRQFILLCSPRTTSIITKVILITWCSKGKDRSLNHQRHVAGDESRRSSLSRVIQGNTRSALRKRYKTFHWSDTWSEVCIAYASLHGSLLIAKVQHIDGYYTDIVYSIA